MNTPASEMTLQDSFAIAALPSVLAYFSKNGCEGASSEWSSLFCEAAFCGFLAGMDRHQIEIEGRYVPMTYGMLVASTAYDIADSMLKIREIYSGRK